jgi:hypothetical protein
MTTTRHTRSILFFPALLFGWLSASCLCTIGLPRLDVQPEQTNAGNGSTNSAAQTRAALENLLGNPRVLATFPSGARVCLFTPQEGQVFSDPWVDVIGSAPEETVVSLNDEITVAGADGLFYARVPLEEGLTEIVCVASDQEGNEVAFSFVIVYEPEQE